jgi:hypothetical protein
MIVMWHKFVYMDGNVRKEIHGSIVAKGEDQRHTSMSKTVGLPLGIATKLILEVKSIAEARSYQFTPNFMNPFWKSSNNTVSRW